MSLPLYEIRFAVEAWLRPQQPQKKWDKEQQAQQTARRNQASEIPTRSSEIAAVAYVPVVGLHDVSSAATAHVCQATWTATSAAGIASWTIAVHDCR